MGEEAKIWDVKRKLGMTALFIGDNIMTNEYSQRTFHLSSPPPPLLSIFLRCTT